MRAGSTPALRDVAGATRGNPLACLGPPWSLDLCLRLVHLKTCSTRLLGGLWDGHLLAGVPGVSVLVPAEVPVDGAEVLEGFTQGPSTREHGRAERLELDLGRQGGLRCPLNF